MYPQVPDGVQGRGSLWPPTIGAYSRHVAPAWNLYRLTPVTPPNLPRTKAKKLGLALEGRPLARRGTQAPPLTGGSRLAAR